MAAGPVEGLHEQSSRLLPFRMFGQERLQGGDGFLDQPGGEQQFGPAFCGDRAQFVEPGRRGQRERPAGELADRRPAPQRQGLVEEPQGLLAAGLVRFGQHVLETGDVELAPLNGQAVAALHGSQVATGRAEGAAQA